jgi:chitodextrinase
VNGTNGFVGVDNSTGQTIRPGRLPHNNNGRRIYQDVLVTDGLVFVAGMEHVTYVLNESDLSIRTLHSTGGTNNAGFQMGGDYQDLEQVGDRVYASCHCRNNHYADGDVFRFRLGEPANWSREDPIKFVAAYSATDGSYIPSFQLDISGSSGVWAIHGAPDGCLWLGGDITRATRADGTNQSRGAFTRHCDPAMTPDTERPSAPTGLVATAGADSVSLSWNASTDNVGVSSYDVYRAATNGGAAVVVGSSTTTTFLDSPLAAGEYWYYLRAIDAAENTSWRTGYRGATVGAAVDTERPGQASNFVVTPRGPDGVALSWNPAADNVGVVGYNIYRAQADAGPYSIVATRATSPFVDSGLAASDYWYYLRAIDAAGNEGWRTAKRMVTVGGEPADTQRPSTPRGLVASTITSDSVTLDWQASTDNVGVANYLVYNTATGAVVATVSSPTAVVSGLSSGTTYSFHVKAIDAAGNSSWRSNIGTITTL